MPQMSPLLWLNLYVFFTIIFLMTIIANFFIKPPKKMSKKAHAKKTKSLNWKW